MNIEFIPYEQALELKELGFKKDNDFGLLYKGNDIPSILYQQAFRWFREKYEFTIHIYNCDYTQQWNFNIYHTIPKERYFDNPLYNNYEEAELECLKKLIEIVKNKL